MPIIAACVISESIRVEERPVFYEFRFRTSSGKCGDVPRVEAGIDRRQGPERYVDLKNRFVTPGYQVSLTIKLPRWKRLKNQFGRVWVAFKNYTPREGVNEEHVDGIPPGKIRVRYKDLTITETKRRIEGTLNQVYARNL
ncbi:hypothetical protein MSAN_01204600 [Mycena sanguinolenta]|uniref:Uncharacterized protein n=1 Tax=Mycena sanguinolenta TaxID=230812 RepID=A0A8H6YFB0_9AGAR|nr:hypothetical protein MSAN_01204600 [Mycena sanguinolenta]